MSQYYGESQWPGAGNAQSTWEHQTPPPPARSGASSTIPREESTAFSYQIEEVERAIDNLVKSGKMFNMPGRHGRVASGSGSSRSHSMSEFGDARGGHSGGNLQNFYASQRHQTSRGSNEAEQMMQAKRRMAAQRERDLRNFHQEQQYNRTVLAEMSYGSKPDRSLSPGGMSEDDRRDLIARQRSALYGDASYSENGAYADEAGAARSGAPNLPTGPSTHRGPSPLTYDFPRSAQSGGPEGGAPPAEISGQGANDRSRADSNASPQSNPGNKGIFDGATSQQATRTSNSSPGGSPPRQGSAPGKPGQTGATVAPIGTRPSATSQAANPALTKRSTTPLPSPLSHGYTAPANDEDGTQLSTSGAPSNPPSAAPEGYNGWGNRSGVWGNKSSLGVQASVWG